MLALKLMLKLMLMLMMNLVLKLMLMVLQLMLKLILAWALNSSWQGHSIGSISFLFTPSPHPFPPQILTIY